MDASCILHEKGHDHKNEPVLGLVTRDAIFLEFFSGLDVSY